MKKIVIIFMLVLGLIGCCLDSGKEKETHYNSLKQYFNYGIIGHDDGFSTGVIVVDKDTGVLYYFSQYRVTPLYNADGTLKNIKDFR